MIILYGKRAKENYREKLHPNVYVREGARAREKKIVRNYMDFYSLVIVYFVCTLSLRLSTAMSVSLLYSVAVTTLRYTHFDGVNDL